MTAVAMIGLLGIASIVLDLSALRQDRASNRLTADAVVTAAASNLGTNSGPAACATAWDYFLINTPNEGAITQVPACPSMLTSCTSMSPASIATGIAAPYRVEIIYPVPADDEIMKPDAIGDPSQAAVTSDGDRCNRIGVRIAHERESLFGKALNFGSHTTTSHSVGLFTNSPGSAPVLPALVTFEQHDCLSVNANSRKITVANNLTFPGLIFSDSDGTGSNCATGVIDAKGGGQIRALDGTGGLKGTIGYFASNGKGYELIDIPPSSSRIVPTPIQQAERLTRRHVDEVYNCSNSLYSPQLCTVDSFGIAQSDPIAIVQSDYRGTAVPSGFTEYTGVCEPGSFDFTTATRWFINCNNGTEFVVKNGTVKFGAGTIVFKGGLKIDSNGILTVGSASADSVIFLRDGGFTSSGNEPNTLLRTFLYSDATTSPPLTMNHTMTDLLKWTPPVSSIYKKLLFWTESSGAIEFNGGPKLQMAGVLMAPNSNFIASGSGLVDATDVQFLVRSATTIGNSELRLRPDPNTGLEFPKAGVELIR